VIAEFEIEPVDMTYEIKLKRFLNLSLANYLDD